MLFLVGAYLVVIVLSAMCTWRYVMAKFPQSGSPSSGRVCSAWAGTAWALSLAVLLIGGKMVAHAHGFDWVAMIPGLIWALTLWGITEGIDGAKAAYDRRVRPVDRF